GGEAVGTRAAAFASGVGAFFAGRRSGVHAAEAHHETRNIESMDRFIARGPLRTALDVNGGRECKAAESRSRRTCGRGYSDGRDPNERRRADRTRQRRAPPNASA